MMDPQKLEEALNNLSNDDFDTFFDQQVEGYKDMLESKEENADIPPMMFLNVIDPSTAGLQQAVIIMDDLPQEGRHEYVEQVGAGLAKQRIIMLSATLVTEAYALAINPDVQPEFRPSEHPASIEVVMFHMLAIRNHHRCLSFKQIQKDDHVVGLGDVLSDSKKEGFTAEGLVHSFWRGYTLGMLA